jgi:hypothetical protein
LKAKANYPLAAGKIDPVVPRWFRATFGHRSSFRLDWK